MDKTPHPFGNKSRRPNFMGGFAVGVALVFGGCAAIALYIQASAEPIQVDVEAAQYHFMPEGFRGTELVLIALVWGIVLGGLAGTILAWKRARWWLRLLVFAALIAVFAGLALNGYLV